MLACDGSVDGAGAIVFSNNTASLLNSSMLGSWLVGEPLDFEVVDREFAWLEHFMDSPTNKLATLMVTTGDPLETPTQVELAYIDGRPVDLTDRHKRLWQKYREKYRRLELGE